MGADKAVGSPAGARSRGREPGAGGQGVTATVVEERPSLVYVVRTETGQEVLAHMVGMVKRNFVRLVAGDKVEVELGPHDATRGRIIRKLGSQGGKRALI